MNDSLSIEKLLEARSKLPAVIHTLHVPPNILNVISKAVLEDASQDLKDHARIGKERVPDPSHWRGLHPKPVLWPFGINVIVARFLPENMMVGVGVDVIVLMTYNEGDNTWTIVTKEPPTVEKRSWVPPVS